MFIPFGLFLNYVSPFPWYLGMVLQLLGFFCLFVTRFTARYYPVWGRRYYLFSSIIRPIGVLLIAWAWLEILAVPTLPFPNLPANGLPLAMMALLFAVYITLVSLDTMLRKIGLIALIFSFAAKFLELPAGAMGLPITAFALTLIAFGYSIWSIFHLGLRRSFLYSRIDDPLITDGPYAYHRHPQLMSAMMMALFSIFCMHPLLYQTNLGSLWGLVNFAVMAVAVKLNVLYEERDLEQRFGGNFLEFSKGVPAFFKNGRKLPKSFWRVFPALCSLSFISSCLIIVFGGEKAGGQAKPGWWLIYPAMNIRQDYYIGVTYRDLRVVSGSITKYMSENNAFPKNLDASMISGWKERNRTLQHTPFPQTLFYCDQAYYSVDPASAPVINGKRLPMVTKLPFPLLCNNQQVEVAEAFDYDADGFAQIYLIVIPAAQNEYYWDNFVRASNDEDNSYSDQIKERIKTGKPLPLLLSKNFPGIAQNKQNNPPPTGGLESLDIRAVTPLVATVNGEVTINTPVAPCGQDNLTFYFNGQAVPGKTCETVLNGVRCKIPPEAQKFHYPPLLLTLKNGDTVLKSKPLPLKIIDPEMKEIAETRIKGQPTTIDPGQTAYGVFANDTDIGWFVFELPNATIVNLTAYAYDALNGKLVEEGGNPDTYLKLKVSGSSELIASNDNSPNSLNASIKNLQLPSGRYTVEVTRVNSSSIPEIFALKLDTMGDRPLIKDLSPAVGQPGDELQITGWNFGYHSEDNIVELVNQGKTFRAEVLGIDSGKIKVRVPKINAVPGEPWTIKLTNKQTGSNSLEDASESDNKYAVFYFAPRLGHIPEHALGEASIQGADTVYGVIGEKRGTYNLKFTGTSNLRMTALLVDANNNRISSATPKIEMIDQGGAMIPPDPRGMVSEEGMAQITFSLPTPSCYHVRVIAESKTTNPVFYRLSYVFAPAKHREFDSAQVISGDEQILFADPDQKVKLQPIKVKITNHGTPVENLPAVFIPLKEFEEYKRLQRQRQSEEACFYEYEVEKYLFYTDTQGIATLPGLEVSGNPPIVKRIGIAGERPQYKLTTATYLILPPTGRHDNQPIDPFIAKIPELKFIPLGFDPGMGEKIRLYVYVRDLAGNPITKADIRIASHNFDPKKHAGNVLSNWEPTNSPGVYSCLVETSSVPDGKEYFMKSVPHPAHGFLHTMTIKMGPMEESIKFAAFP